MRPPLIEVRGLTITLRDAPHTVILEDVSLSVPRGTIVGVVGGSGSGKTTLGLAMLGMVPPAMRVRGGKVIIDGQDVLALDASKLRQLRGAHISMSFQEAASAFDPVFTVGEQILETLAAHQNVRGELARRRLEELLALAEVPDARRVAGSYPHELSGGLRQRAMLALALCLRPALLVADEPTSSLDVTLQARIMELLRKFRRELGLSVVLISHDLGMVRRLADETVILNRGRVVAEDHPYARALMAAQEM